MDRQPARPYCVNDQDAYGIALQHHHSLALPDKINIGPWHEYWLPAEPGSSRATWL